jgi:hypothetical protein
MENGDGPKKEKRSKKERNGGLWKLTPLMEIRPQRGFPPRLGKQQALSTVPHRQATAAAFPSEEGDISILVRMGTFLNWFDKSGIK